MVSIQDVLCWSMRICEGDYIKKMTYDNNERKMSLQREGWKRDVIIVWENIIEVVMTNSTNLMQVWKWINLMYKVS